VLPNVDLLVVDDSKSIGDDSVSTAGGCLHKSWISLLVVVLPVLLIGSTKLRAVDCCDPNSPFREGEGWADEPAICENIRTGPNGLRQRTQRISLAIKGKLSAVDAGVLAYLVMCDAPGMQVTYETNGMRPGDVVAFGGGYERSGPKRVIIDPCLASRE
jgi:hypothetical protein